jgi:hypothetical protein
VSLFPANKILIHKSLHSWWGWWPGSLWVNTHKVMMLQFEVIHSLLFMMPCWQRVFILAGAIGAQWLGAFKSYIENPVTLMLWLGVKLVCCKDHSVAFMAETNCAVEFKSYKRFMDVDCSRSSSTRWSFFPSLFLPNASHRSNKALHFVENWNGERIEDLG